MIVAAHQPNFLPWCGFFAKLIHCDTFVLLDDVQMTKQSYVARTSLRSGEAQRWLSVPVNRGLSFSIRDVRIADRSALRKHLAAFQTTYGKAPHFREVFGLVTEIYDQPIEGLADFNRALIEMACLYIGIERNIVLSSSFALSSTSDDRLIDLTSIVGGTTYLSGSGGTNYQDPAKFADAGIALRVSTYKPVPYEAAKFPFIPGLSIIDALFIYGKSTIELLKYRNY